MTREAKTDIEIESEAYPSDDPRRLARSDVGGPSCLRRTHDEETSAFHIAVVQSRRAVAESRGHIALGDYHLRKSNPVSTANVALSSGC